MMTVTYNIYGISLIFDLIFFFCRQLLIAQRKIAMFSEMVHSASLVHDDVIDQSDFRRGKPSVNVLWNHKKVIVVLQM